MKKTLSLLMTILTSALAYSQTNPKLLNGEVLKNVKVTSAATVINLETIDEWLCPKKS